MSEPANKLHGIRDTKYTLIPMEFRSFFLTLTFALIVYAAGTAHAFTAVVHPVEITRGDPFVVVVGNTVEEPGIEFKGQPLPFTSCGEGCFMALGVAPLDTESGNHPIKVSDAGLSVSLAIRVQAGEFAKQSLTLPKDKVSLSPEDEARADEEALRMRGLWAIVNPRLWEGDFIMPLGGGISTEFGTVRLMNETKQSIHSGLDIRGGYGAPILAANTGRVVMNEDTFFGGNTVILDHGMGLYTVYMHMQESRVVGGEVVDRAEIIGLVGSTGRSTGPHLHYSVKLAATNVNPHSLVELPLGRAQAMGLESATARAENSIPPLTEEQQVQKQ